MGSEEVAELDDCWWLGWRGMTIDRVEAGLLDTVVTIGGTSRLTLADTAASTISPVNAAATATPVSRHSFSSLVGATVLSAVAFKNGALRLVFDTGIRLDVHPSNDVATWHAVGPSHIWAAPQGGGLDVTDEKPT